MKRLPLLWQVVAAVSGVAMLSVAVAGAVTRAVTSRVFEAYLRSLPMPGRGMGRRILLGGAEQAFLRGVDRGIAIAAFLALALAVVAALVFANRLARPLSVLAMGARRMARGELGTRVPVEGPLEVAEVGGAFNEMAASLQSAEDLRRQMVSDVAHELRNPLASLRGQAEGVAEGVLAGDAERMRGIVEDVAHLSKLVDELHELAVAEAGRLRYEWADVDLCDLARREIDRARALAAEGVRLKAACEEPVRATADEGRLAQVLRNLLSNAARHTTEGEIVVEVATLPTGRASVTVRDTGEGIAEEDLPYVFERFYRADSARARDTGGAGLGLAIAKRIVEDHGGSVFVQSPSGGGTEIGFVLPASS